MNLKSDFKTLLSALKGATIKHLEGSNIEIYFSEKDDLFYQFHQGMLLHVESVNGVIECYTFNGRILEEKDGQDSFFMDISKNNTPPSNSSFSKLHLRSKGLFFRIKMIAPYYYGTGNNKQLFALHFQSDLQQSFLIRFDFPADGLHLSLNKQQIDDFFNIDHFGKSLCLDNSFDQQT